MRYLKILSFCGLLLIWGMPAHAEKLMGLYEAEVVAADQGREARAAAMSEAMAEVLIKVNGSADVLELGVIQFATADASRYVQQYRYHSEPIPPEERQPVTEGEPAPETRLLLWVSFDQSSIDSLLRRYGYTVWSAARPTTLVWLGVDDVSRRVLVGANDQGLVREVLDAESQRRAIPLRLPLLDLTDQSKLRVVDVWGGFIDNIEAASERYEAQAVLFGKLYSAGANWEARWTLLYQGEQHEWQHKAADVTEVIKNGVAGTSEYLSEAFAESSYLGIDQLALRIEGIDDMDDFRRSNDYLQSLHGVSAVTLRRVDANSSSFLLQIEGGRETVLQAIARGDVLVEVEQPFEEPEVPAVQPVLPIVEPETAPPSTLSPEHVSPVEGEPSQQVVETVEEMPSDIQPEVIPIQELVYRLLS